MRFNGYKIALIVLMMSPTFNSFYASNLKSFSSKVDAIFKETNTDNRPGCAVGVIKDNQYIHNAGYGMANLEHGIKITPDSIFRMASVSKQFTAMAIALLEEKNLLSFDDPMDKHIPNLIDYQETVTIKHMIHHFSGLGDYEVSSYPNRFKNAVGEEFRWGNEDYMSNSEFYEMIKTLPLIMEPETKFHYSNTGYALLALVAENVSGMSLREFAGKEIFQPLGMDDSFFNDNVNLIVKNRADGYSPIKRQPGKYEINMTNLSWVGDGGVYTSINDFIKWDQNFYDNKLGAATPSLIKTMEQTFLETKVKKRNQTLSREREGQHTYAFAQNLAYYNGYKRWSHSGSWVAYTTHYTRFPEIRFSVVVLCNNEEIGATAVSDEIIDLYFQENKDL
jgi:CubicO group peptidase (beta-lactamase class C family)